MIKKGVNWMNEQTTFFYRVLPLFFKQFQNITYHGVPICQYTYRLFMSFWSSSRIHELLPFIQNKTSDLSSSEIYHKLDGPYPCKPNPNGIILMRGGFGNLASLYLPKERFIMMSPNQAEVDLIKLNQPDLSAHNIQNYYQENPGAVKSLNQQVAQVLAQLKDDPILGTPDLAGWFQIKIPEFVRTLDAVWKVFQEFNIGAVLTISSTYSMDGALNLMAKAKGIPSFTAQHGLIAEHDLFAHVPVLATKKMVWGRANLEWYRKFGYPESRVSIIGSPRFDSIFNQKWCGKEKLHQILGINQNQKIIVFGAQIIRFTQVIAPIILEGLKSIPDLFLLMMLHPGEKPQPYLKLTEGYPHCKVVQFGHISLYDALSGADLFVTYYSTAAIEAMFFKLPVITVEPMPPTFSFGALGASIKVKNAIELHQVAHRLLNDETFRVKAINLYQNFLQQYCIPDGSSSKRLFEEIESMMQKGTEE